MSGARERRGEIKLPVPRPIKYGLFIHLKIAKKTLGLTMILTPLHPRRQCERIPEPTAFWASRLGRTGTRETAMLKVYSYYNSICTQKVFITLAEKRLDYTTQNVDLFRN
jgi:hypothetical protein